MDFSTISTEELKDLIARSEYSQSHQEPEPGWLSKAGNVAGRFNELIESSRLPAVAGGIFQGIGDIGASIGNIVARPLGHPIPHPEFSKYFDKSPLTKIAFGAGELGAQLPLYGTGAGLIGKLGLTKGIKLSDKIIEGLAAGTVMGEDSEGNRMTSAALGAALPVAGKVVKGLSDLKSKNIARNVVKGFKNAESQSAKEFQDIFKEVKDRDIKKMHPIEAKMNLLTKEGDQKYIHSLHEYNKNPTIENAHSAQSDLAKYAKKIGKPENKLERDARNEAKNISDELRQNMMMHLHKTGNIDLALRYHTARDSFKHEVGPYLNSKALKDLMRNDLRAKNFANKIAEEESFMTKLGQHKHPEIERRAKLKKALNNKAVQYGIGTGLSGLGLYEASKLFK
jgi:hypothetical protein